MGEEKQTKVIPIPSQTPEKLQEIAIGILGNGIFTDRHIHPEEWKQMLPHIFMPIFFGGLAEYDLKTLGLVYEYYSQAGPRAINGYPIFMSMNMLNQEDAKRVWELMEVMKKPLVGAAQQLAADEAAGEQLTDTSDPQT